MSLQISSPFGSSVPVPTKEFTEREFVHYMEVESVSSDFDKKKPSEFLIEKTIEEYERIPIDDYINSFASKVGLKNELKGIITKQQMDAYIEEHKARPGFVDLTKLPDSQFDIEKVAARIDEIWDSIPSELKGKQTKEEFLSSLTREKIESYVLSEVKKSLTTEEKKEGE